MRIDQKENKKKLKMHDYPLFISLQLINHSFFQILLNKTDHFLLNQTEENNPEKICFCFFLLFKMRVVIMPKSILFEKLFGSVYVWTFFRRRRGGS